MSDTLARVSTTSTKTRAAGTQKNSATDQVLVPLQQKEWSSSPSHSWGTWGLTLLVLPSQLGLLEECERKRSRKENKNRGRITRLPESIITLHQHSLCVGTNEHPKARVWRQFLAVAEQAYDLVLDNNMSQG